mgnify:CR=1 FL=1
MKEWPLGKNIAYETNYNPELLSPVSRQLTRENIGVAMPLPFKGVDIWNAWEISWLNSSGKPVVANARLQYSAESAYLIESKSLKLYLNSLNQTKFASKDEVLLLLQKDLSQTIESEVKVILYTANEAWPTVQAAEGLCLDELELTVTDYQLSPKYLSKATNEINATVSEQLYSHLFKSNCMVTGQPDWATIFISYTGTAIDHSLLLQYLISYRNHQAFHEPCVERIFVDLMKYCKPEALSVYCRYTRRGGIDINPYRSTSDFIPSNERIWRQ